MKNELIKKKFLKARRLALSALLVLSIFSFTACSFAGGSDTLNASADKIVTAVGGNPQNYGAEYVLYSALGRLAASDTFEEVSLGEARVKKGALDYLQKIYSRKIKNGGEFYFESDSSSALTTSAHRAFEKDGKVAFLDGNRGDIICTSGENYKNVYGVLPSKLLCGLVLNEQTVVSARRDNEAAIFDSRFAGASVYVYEIDRLSGTVLCSLQTRELGLLCALPNYTENPLLTLVLGSDFSPLSIEITQKYNIESAVMGELSCELHIKSEFSKFNEEVEIPNAEEYGEALCSTPERINALNVTANKNVQELIPAALASDISGGVLFSGNASYNGAKIPIKIHIKADLNAILSGADIESSLKLSISALPTINYLTVFYDGERIYFKVAGVKCYFSPSISGESSDGSGSSSSESANPLGDALDLLSYFEIEKSTDDDRIYTLTLTKEARSLITAALKQGGVLGENEDFSVAIETYIAGGRIGTIQACVALGGKTFSLELAISDKRFVLPDDLAEYAPLHEQTPDFIIEDIKETLGEKLTSALEELADIIDSLINAFPR